MSASMVEALVVQAELMLPPAPIASTTDRSVIQIAGFTVQHGMPCSHLRGGQQAERRAGQVTTRHTDP